MEKDIVTIDPDYLRDILNFKDLLRFLQEHLDWNIEGNLEDITFDYTFEELGIEADQVSVGIKELRPLQKNQPWGIFFLEFEDKNLSVTVIRAILRSFVKRKRQSVAAAGRPSWDMEDLLFICSYVFEGQRAITFIHFSQPEVKGRVAKLSSFGWTSDSHNRTVVEFNLPPLRWPVGTTDSTGWRSKWIEAFNKQKLTDVFFGEYQALFEILQKDLYKQSNDDVWAHDYALQFLNRCMFLYFVQRKRWIMNDPEFLMSFWNAFKQSNQPKDSFVEKWLHVLFFEVFNNNKNLLNSHQREYIPETFRSALWDAPWLNGGLFRKNDLDTKYDFTISDDRFFQILTFLERYNFTVSEDTPLDQEVAVDAEMLGRVYESLVNLSDKADKRGEAGIFYTPRTEIYLMCRLSLVDYLTNHLGEQYKSLLYEAVFAYAPDEKRDIDRRLQEENLWSELDLLLQKITVVDPACGSGSFLIGMLQVLDDLTDRTNAVLGRQETPYERRKRIIGQSLYGVDVMHWAVDVAELRLWLQLVIETDLETAELTFRPLLPNLSFKVRCGDSLVQEVGTIPLAHLKISHLPSNIKGKLTSLKGEKLKFFHNDPTCRFKSEKALFQEEFSLFREILETEYLSVVGRLKSLRHDIESQTSFFGDVERPKNLFEREITELEELKDTIAQELSGLHTDQAIPFVWDIAFVEIFEGEKQGFDIVIGNPPYVRQESISDPRLKRETVTPQNKKVYKTKLINSVYRLYPHFFGYHEKDGTATHKINAKSDLYIFFYFHGLSLLNEKGAFCFITSNSWLDVGYGKDLQEFLLKYGNINMIIDNKVKRSFKSADVNTIIALLAPPRKKALTLSERAEAIARFVMFQVPFEQIITSVIFQEIEEATDRRNTPEYRVYPISQNKLLTEGCEFPDYDSDITAQLKTRGPSIKIAQYIGNKWGGKYLRAPDIYWTILKKGKGKLFPLGKFAKIKYGIKTGADGWFHVKTIEKDKNYSKIVSGDGSIHVIETEFLRPLVRSLSECDSYIINPRDLLYNIVIIDTERPLLKKLRVNDYIKYGELTNYPSRTGGGIPAQRPSCVSRGKEWYRIKYDKIPLGFMFKIRRDKHFIVKNNGALGDDALYEIYSPFDILLPILNSTLTALFIEIIGRTPGGGSGPLAIMVSESLTIPVINPNKLNRAQKESIYNEFEIMKNRNVMSIIDELQIKDRNNLDKYIFDALRLSTNEREAVYQAVLELVEARLKKAGSLSLKNRLKRSEAVKKTIGIWTDAPDADDEDEE